jgi:NAD(P)-dependent dehydrogenase (short-subunit alcohol dehydrogenase family)
MPPLEGKVALVTGATRNTGLAIAQALHAAGATVYLNGRRPEDVEAARVRLGARARGVPADLADDEATAGMVARVQREAGRLDVLVNNACHQGTGHAALETPLRFWDEVLAVNLRAAFHACTRAAALMRERGGGSIVNIGSSTARRAIRDRAAYIASKGGLEALTRALAVEWGPYGIRVNLVTPGYIHTDRWDAVPRQRLERRRANLPLGREAMPADVASAVVFLASPASGNMTGSEVALDGGAGAQAFPADAEDQSRTPREESTR